MARSYKTLDDRVSEANDVAQTADRPATFTFLANLPLPVLRGVADLNYVDPFGTRDDLIFGLMGERFGA